MGTGKEMKRKKEKVGKQNFQTKHPLVALKQLLYDERIKIKIKVKIKRDSTFYFPLSNNISQLMARG